jgi:hypothetical protein
MKALHYKLSGWITVALVVTFSISQCTEMAGVDETPLSGNNSVPSVIQGVQLTGAEIEGIRFMREEEKLARDVYLTLYETYPLRPFLNISKSEQAHMDAIKYLIDTYQLDDPVGENPVGVFRNEELQELYNSLIERGIRSREEALRVGALIEEVDIIDLRSELDSVALNEEVIRIYTNLSRGSENHLRAFTGVLALYGVEYTPVQLTQEEYNRIVND